MSKATLSAIFDQHGVATEDRAAMTALVVTGKRPGKGLRNRLKTRYRGMLNDVLAVLSMPYARYFAF